jgi:hypothetical protein
MQEDAEMPNPECKARNIKDAFDILIKTGKPLYFNKNGFFDI